MNHYLSSITSVFFFLVSIVGADPGTTQPANSAIESKKMKPLEISHDFESGSFPEQIKVTQIGLQLWKTQPDNHFYFHFKVTNPSDRPRSVEVACKWPLTKQQYGLFPELCRQGQKWQRIEVVHEPRTDPTGTGQAHFSFQMAPHETVFLANTPCMGYSEVHETLKTLAAKNPTKCTLLNLGRSSENNEVMGLRFDEKQFGTPKPKIVILGTSQAPEYGERLACGIAEFLSGTSPEAVSLRKAYRIDVIPMPCPDPKRQGSHVYQVLFDFGKAAAEDPKAAWHATTLWQYLKQDPPEFLIELHSETRNKGNAGNRLYVAAEDVYLKLDQGRRAWLIVRRLDKQLGGDAITKMSRDTMWTDTLLYQASHRLDTISIIFTGHIRYGVEDNVKTVSHLLTQMVKK